MVQRELLLCTWKKPPRRCWYLKSVYRHSAAFGAHSKDLVPTTRKEGDRNTHTHTWSEEAAIDPRAIRAAVHRDVLVLVLESSPRAATVAAAVECERGRIPAVAVRSRCFKSNADLRGPAALARTREDPALIICARGSC